MTIRATTCWMLLAAGAALAGTPPPQPAAAATNPPVAIAAAMPAPETNALARLERRLQASLDELAAVRQRIGDERVPLGEELSRLERDQIEARKQYETLRRQFDGQNLELNNLRATVKTREQEKQYLTSLLTEYVRNFETHLHIAEVSRYQAALRKARLAAENSALAAADVFASQQSLVETSLTRLEEMIGGALFDGQAIGPDGVVRQGRFLLLGPVACFRSDDGDWVGEAEQRLGSLEPAILPYGLPAERDAAAALVATRHGTLPLDGSLGNARKMAETKETIRQHILKGGPVMAPILGLAALVALVALIKWLQLTLTRCPGEVALQPLLDAVLAADRPAAAAAAARLRGPAGAMLRAGVTHLHGSRELIEETMYETILDTRHRLNRALPFIAVGAACAPLLGLLGTVTGIISTFKMITVFGSGDIKMLSAGISEALITTEYGLYVAIPSILAHSFLARKAKGIMDRLERVGMAFVNDMLRARNLTEKAT